MKLKTFFLYIFLVVFALALPVCVQASTDCLYSPDYTYYSDFEAHRVGTSPNVFWKAQSGGSMEIVSEPVYKGERAAKFTGGIIYQTGTNEWSFKAGDVLEISGYFKADNTANIKLVSETVSIGNKWVYVSERYTIPSDGATYAPRATVVSSSGGYVYADNLSVRRVLQTDFYTKILKIETENNIYAAIDGDNGLWLWGEDDNYILNSTNTYMQAPEKVMDGVKDVCIGDDHIVVLRTDDTVWTWGANTYGQLGNGTLEDSQVPVKIAEDCKAIAAGNQFTVVVTNNGVLKGTGRCDLCQYGSPSNEHLVTELRDVTISGYQKVSDVFASDDHTFIRLGKGELYGIGQNPNAQLGLGNFLPVIAFTKIMDKRILGVSASDNYTLVTTHSGELYGMGFGEHGQLGKELTLSKTPVLLAQNVTGAAAGKYSSYKITNDGTFSSLGNESSGIANAADNAAEETISMSPVAVACDTNIMCVTKDGALYVNGELTELKEEIDDTEQDPEPIVPDIPKTIPYGLSFGDDDGILYNFDSEKHSDAVLILAGYKDERCVSVKVIDFTNDGNTLYTIPSMQGADRCKVMLWKDMNSIKPLEHLNIITVADVNVEVNEENGKYSFTVSGTTAAINGEYDDETVITITASVGVTPTVKNIFAMEQFNVDSTGAFSKTIPIRTNPENTYFNIRISGEKITNLIN